MVDTFQLPLGNDVIPGSGGRMSGGKRDTLAGVRRAHEQYAISIVEIGLVTSRLGRRG